MKALKKKLPANRVLGEENQRGKMYMTTLLQKALKNQMGQKAESSEREVVLASRWSGLSKSLGMIFIGLLSVT